MNVPIRERLGANVDSELLAALRDLAAHEGPEIDGLIDEAVVDLIEKRRGTGARPHVMTARLSSLQRYIGAF